MAYKDALLSDLHITKLTPTLSDIQSDAVNQFQSEGIPTIKHEEWKFTNLNKVFNQDFAPIESTGLALDDQLANFDQYTIVFENGKLDASRSTFVDTNELEITDLTTKLADQSFTDNVFNQAFKGNPNPMINLNTALLQGGIYIKVKRGKTVDKPIVIQQLLDATSTNIAAYSRFIIEIEENAEACIINSTKTDGSNGSMSNLAGEITVGKAARLKYYTLQNDIETASQINNIAILQDRDSVIDTNTISLNGELIRNNLDIILNGEYIESNFSSVYLLKGKTHVDNHTVADHKFPNCNSNELYKGIMDERSRGVFNGKIFVREDAQKTNAFQSNNNILLSDHAIINTKPQLEIWADDVSCSHGCTIGQLDTEALFYLKARGIGEVKAKALLLESFAMEVVEKISFEPFRNYISELISERFGNAR